MIFIEIADIIVRKQQHTHGLVVRDQRHGDHRAKRLVALIVTGKIDPARIFADIRHHRRLLVLRDPADNALAHREARVAEGIFAAEHGAVDQVIGFRLDQHDRAMFDADQLGQRAERAFEQRIAIQRAGGFNAMSCRVSSVSRSICSWRVRSAMRCSSTELKLRTSSYSRVFQRDCGLAGG